jgi:uncharacterized protein YndB with AHSA1/START domain
MKHIDIAVSRTIPATAAEVFDAWLDHKTPGGPWFGVERAIVQPSVDGLFYHLVKWEGRAWPHYGRFIALDKPRRIQHTWVSEATKGIETVVTVTLEPKGKDTEVSIAHTGLLDDEQGRGHKDGWTFMLDMIHKRFSK